VFVVGVGMTKFEKPGSKEWDYPDMAEEAGTKALADAGIDYALVEQAAVGYCYGDSTAGQRALYTLGLSGIPAINVNNNCSTGSSALYLAKKYIEGGLADCAIALGFEKMEKGSLGIKYTDRTTPLDKHFEDMVGRREYAPASPPAPQMFGNAGREYMEKYGVSAESFARIGEKNHRHSVNNPYSQFRDEYSLEDILNAPMVYDPLTKLQCCPTSDGAGAAILASERFVREHGLEAHAVEIVGMAMTTDFESTFSGSDMKLVGFDMTKAAAQQVYEQSGYGPEDVDVIELHDCFSANELITYEGLGLCGEGKAGELIDSGAVTYGGDVVVNPSGGLISKGHPLGATGLAQCAELNWQLRDEAEKRQVDGASVALQHNLGLGGAAVVTMYAKANLS
jgi:acetyl-CoA acyltransferase